jgi:hypothetical protein
VCVLERCAADLAVTPLKTRCTARRDVKEERHRVRSVHARRPRSGISPAAPRHAWPVRASRQQRVPVRHCTARSTPHRARRAAASARPGSLLPRHQRCRPLRARAACSRALGGPACGPAPARCAVEARECGRMPHAASRRASRPAPWHRPRSVTNDAPGGAGDGDAHGSSGGLFPPYPRRRPGRPGVGMVRQPAQGRAGRHAGPDRRVGTPT